MCLYAREWLEAYLLSCNPAILGKQIQPMSQNVSAETLVPLHDQQLQGPHGNRSCEVYFSEAQGLGHLILLQGTKLEDPS